MTNSHFHHLSILFASAPRPPGLFIRFSFFAYATELDHDDDPLHVVTTDRFGPVLKGPSRPGRESRV
jgi:hypothetical protein